MKDIKEFENWYKIALKNKDEQLKLVWEIMRSPYVEYHYSLITNKETSEEFRQKLWSRFDEHKEKGAELLLSKLDNNEDVAFHAGIIFCLGKFKIEKERTLEYVRKFTQTEDDLLRETAIIVLGWIWRYSRHFLAWRTFIERQKCQMPRLVGNFV